MAMKTEHIHSPDLSTDRHHEHITSRIIPVPDTKSNMSAPSSTADAMDVESAASNSPANNSPPATQGEPEKNGKAALKAHDSAQDGASASGNMPAPSAAGAAQQPKIVQTAFIHKLYNMLEDTSIQHLISWSSTAESFVMSPTADFSKVLSQYFKHTNISSFVRQLNMYGFHKERDVFHTGNPDTTLWEFKHGNGNFKRGDLASLREIKRRASKHTPIHKDNTYVKSNSSQPGTPAEPVQLPPETTEARVANLEQSLYDMAGRLLRTEETVHYLHGKAQATMDTLSRVLHLNQELTRSLLVLAPADSAVHHDVLALQSEMQRQADLARSYDEPQQEAPYAGPRTYLSGPENPPVSPRQLPQDDPRRLGPGRAGQPYRPLVSSNLSAGSRRPYGSIGGSSPNQSSPLRNAPAAPPPAPHLLPPATAESLASGTGRRHTSADIRAHGWQPAPSPYSSNPPSGVWPSSPSRVPPEDQHQRLRESLSSYSLQSASHAHPRSRPTTPPPPAANGGQDAFGSWTWNSAGSRESKGPGGFKDSSAPPTRRGSMAHILNPSETAERAEEDEEMRGDDDRKRKRMQ